MRRLALRALLAGYAGLLVAPLGPVAFERPVPGFAVAAVLGAVAAAIATVRVDPVSWLDGPRSVALALVPTLWVASVVAAPAEGVPWLRLGGALAVLPGLVAVALAHDTRQAQRRRAATTTVSFTARPAPTVRRQLTVAAAVVLAAGVVVGVGLPLYLGDGVSVSSFVWLPALVPAWIGLLDGDGREVAVTDRGLRVERTLHDWEGFAAFAVTDDALRLHRDAWYRSSLSFDRDDVEDLDAVVRALGRHLSRRESPASSQRPIA
jgi:hypothetical protein